MREQIINALKAHARGHIEKHKVNVENLIQNNVHHVEPDYSDPDTIHSPSLFSSVFSDSSTPSHK